jgi:hypothetical protein
MTQTQKWRFSLTEWNADADGSCAEDYPLRPNELLSIPVPEKWAGERFIVRLADHGILECEGEWRKSAPTEGEVSIPLTLEHHKYLRLMRAALPRTFTFAELLVEANRETSARLMRILRRSDLLRRLNLEGVRLPRSLPFKILGIRPRDADNLEQIVRGTESIPDEMEELQRGTLKPGVYTVVVDANGGDMWVRARKRGERKDHDLGIVERWLAIRDLQAAVATMEAEAPNKSRPMILKTIRRENAELPWSAQTMERDLRRRIPAKYEPLINEYLADRGEPLFSVKEHEAELKRLQREAKLKRAGGK